MGTRTGSDWRSGRPFVDIVSRRHGVTYVNSSKAAKRCQGRPDQRDHRSGGDSHTCNQHLRDQLRQLAEEWALDQKPVKVTRTLDCGCTVARDHVGPHDCENTAWLDSLARERAKLRATLRAAGIPLDGDE